MAGLPVTCRRVVHIYRAEAGDVVALAGVDLTIAPGEMLALVGPSGSGKSTLIALLSGLMRPSAGRVSIGTYDIGKLTDAEISRLRGTEVGVVLQGAARNLLPYASLSRNIWLAQTRAAGTKGVKLADLRLALPAQADEVEDALGVVELDALGAGGPGLGQPDVARQRRVREQVARGAL